MGRKDKRRKREKRRQAARREKRRKLLAGTISEEWLEWPLVRTCATSAESWAIAGEAVLYACRTAPPRQGETSALGQRPLGQCPLGQCPFPYCVCLVNLFRGGIDDFVFVRGETEADFETHMREMSRASGYRIGDVDPEAVSRLFWGAHSFAVRMGRNFTAAERSAARFIPQPQGDPGQWADKLSGEWHLISPRLIELAQSHQVVREQEAMVFTTLRCRVSDREKLVAFLMSRSPEIVGGQEEDDGSLHFDWTGPVPQADRTGDSQPPAYAEAQRLLAQASIRENILTVETRTAAWAARFYELILRNTQLELTVEDVAWRSFREILPP